MIEILLTIIIVLIALYILRNNIKKSKNGKCSGGCENCNKKDKCH